MPRTIPTPLTLSDGIRRAPESCLMGICTVAVVRSADFQRGVKAGAKAGSASPSTAPTPTPAARRPQRRHPGLGRRRSPWPKQRPPPSRPRQRHPTRRGCDPGPDLVVRYISPQDDDVVRAAGGRRAGRAADPLSRLCRPPGYADLRPTDLVGRPEDRHNLGRFGSTQPCS